jgi:hypothetical protein
VTGRGGAIGVMGALMLVWAGACSSSSAASGPNLASLPVGTVADDGFRPGANGFPFENYGGVLTDGAVPINLTAADVEEMFGAAVCVDAKSRRCDLIPEAQAWLDSTNAAMDGGHCYGFSVLAGQLWLQQVRPTTYGAAATTSLRISDNTALQRQIAYDWTLQTLDSVQSKKLTGTPDQVLGDLIKVLKPHPSQTYTLTFWKPDFTGGHAVTPFEVQNEGGGHFKVLIYDNNWPGQTRAIDFDTNADTWTYDAAINPGVADSVYEGNAESKTISLAPTSPGLGTQPCPFCAKVPTTASKDGKGNVEEISLQGGDTSHANVIITDDAGRRVGYVNGQPVDEIPGARIDQLAASADWTERVSPDFYVPADNTYTISVDGSALTAQDTESLDVTGPSYDVSVTHIVMNPGDKDTLVLHPDATQLSYSASDAQTPTIKLGVSDSQADYSFSLAGLADQPGNTLNIGLPAEGQTLKVQMAGQGRQSNVTFEMTRGTEQGVQAFRYNALPLLAGDVATFQFGSWAGADQSLPLTITHDSQPTTQALRNGGSGSHP